MNYHFSLSKCGVALFAISLSLNSLNAQSVGINTTGATPNASSVLDVSSSTSGMLIPRVTSAQKTAMNPLPAAAQGLVVYQTNGTEGFYYNTSTTTTPNWVRLSNDSDGWQLSGNAGTTAGTDFVGTSDDVDFVLKTNNTERVRFERGGDVGIGEGTPAQKLHVTHDGDGEGVMAIDNATNGGFAGIYFYQNGASNYRGHIGYVNTGGASGFGGKGDFQMASGNRDIVFSATDGAESFTEVVRIEKDGDVNFQTSDASISIWADDSGTEATLRPSTANWGYVGTQTYYWYRMYAAEYLYEAAGNDWTAFDAYDDLELLNNIGMTFKYDAELEHNVAIIDPTTIPKCITNYEDGGNGQFINSKKLDGLFIGSFRQMDFETKLRDERLDNKVNQIAQSGAMKYRRVTGEENAVKNEVYVAFTAAQMNELNGQVPNVQVTPYGDYNKYFVKNRTAQGFTLVVDADNEFAFGWNASVEVESSNESIDVFAPSNWGQLEGDYPLLERNEKPRPTK